MDGGMMLGSRWKFLNNFQLSAKLSWDWERSSIIKSLDKVISLLGEFKNDYDYDYDYDG